MVTSYYGFFFLSEYSMILLLIKCSSLVPRPIPRFSMLHTEKQEGLVYKITHMTLRVEGWWKGDYCTWA